MKEKTLSVSCTYSEAGPLVVDLIRESFHFFLKKELVFGIFDDPDKAEFARDQLKISGLSKQTFLTTVSKPGGTKYGKK